MKTIEMLIETASGKTYQQEATVPDDAVVDVWGGDNYIKVVNVSEGEETVIASFYGDLQVSVFVETITPEITCENK